MSTSPHRRFLLLGIAAALALALLARTGRGSAQDEAVPIEEYWALVAAAQQAASADPPDTGELNALAARLDSIDAVRLPEGSTAPLDSTYLAGLLRSAEPDSERLRPLLTTLLDQRSDWPQSSFTTEDQEALDRVLAREEFQWPEKAPNPLQEWLRRAQRWFLEQVARLAPAVELTGPFLNGMLLALFGGALLLLLAFIYRSTLRSVVREAVLDPLSGLAAPLSTDDALRRAQEAAVSGDRRNAVRFLYMAAQFSLEEAGFIRPDPSRTHREILADLAGRPALSANMQAVADVFERAWYGFRPIDQAEYDATAETVRALRRRGE